MHATRVDAQQLVEVDPDIVIAAKCEGLARALGVAKAGVDGVGEVVVLAVAFVPMEIWPLMGKKLLLL